MGCSSRLAGLFFRPALPGLSTYSDNQTSCGSPKLPTSCTSSAAHHGFSHCLAPKAVLSAPSLVIQAWAARAGPGCLPPQDPTSHPPPASCPPAPRGLCSLFLRAALPPAARCRLHCLEPPVRRRGSGGLGGTGALPSASLPPPPAPPGATLTDASHPTGIGCGICDPSAWGGGKNIGGAT